MRLPHGPSAALCLLALVLCAAHAAGKGSVSGTIHDGNGRPVPGIKVKLEQDQPIPAPRGGEKKPPAGQKRPRKPVAEATTDKDGKFTFTELQPGAYRIIAGNRQIGWIYQDVEVKADEETRLGDTKLIKPNG